MSAIQKTYQQASEGLYVQNTDGIQDSPLTEQELIQQQIESFYSCLQLLDL
jgi:hypothetical protein